MSAVLGFLLFAGVVVFLVWNLCGLVKDFKARKGRKKNAEDVKNLPNEDKDK